MVPPEQISKYYHPNYADDCRAPVKHQRAVSPLANVATVFSPKQAVSQSWDVSLSGEAFKIQATKNVPLFREILNKCLLLYMKVEMKNNSLQVISSTPLKDFNHPKLDWKNNISLFALSDYGATLQTLSRLIWLTLTLPVTSACWHCHRVCYVRYVNSMS